MAKIKKLPMSTRKGVKIDRPDAGGAVEAQGPVSMASGAAVGGSGGGARLLRTASRRTRACAGSSRWMSIRCRCYNSGQLAVISRQ